MDFIVLFVVYMLLCVVCTSLYAISDQPFMKTGLVGNIRYSTSTVVCIIFPEWSRKLIYDVIDRVFYKRNCVFQVMYLSICLSGYYVLFVDVIPSLYFIQPDGDHVIVPAVLFIVCKCLYVLCCVSDPGYIDKKNQRLYESVYPYDGAIYQPGVKCSTCNIVKPARSKHCSRCNRCICKFDHHCIWTNSCIGGKNCGLFFIFLISLCMMNINGIIMPVRLLRTIVVQRQLWSAQYVGSDGVMRPVSFWVLVQHLFMQYPRMVFMVAALTAVTSLIFGFLLYHVYLNLTNQTTNERYKFGAARYDNPYDKGVVRNLREAFQPGATLRRAVLYKSATNHRITNINNNNSHVRQNVDELKRRC